MDYKITTREEDVEKYWKIFMDAVQSYHVEPDEMIDRGWFVIDVSRAEPEVNWPGDLMGEYDTYEEAKAARWKFSLIQFLEQAE